MASTAYSDTVERLLADTKAGIRTKHSTKDTRSAAVSKLRQHVELELRETNVEQFSVFLDALVKRFFREGRDAADGTERLGWVAVIDGLIDISCKVDSEKKMLIHFHSFLVTMLQQAAVGALPSVEEMLRSTAKALGHIAQAGGTHMAHLVEKEIRRALEWVQDTKAERRFAAVLVLNEMAQQVRVLVAVGALPLHPSSLHPTRSCSQRCSL